MDYGTIYVDVRFVHHYCGVELQNRTFAGFLLRRYPGKDDGGGQGKDSWKASGLHLYLCSTMGTNFVNGQIIASGTQVRATHLGFLG